MKRAAYIPITLAFFWATLTEGPSQNLQKEYTEAKKSYQHDLYKAQLPLQRKQLTRLQAARKRAEESDLTDLVARLTKRIDTLSKTIEKHAKLVDEPVPEIPVDQPTETEPPPPKPPPPVRVDFTKAKLEGGVRLDPKRKALRGWQKPRDKCQVAIELNPELTYEVEITFASIDSGRLKFELPPSKFLPELEDSGGYGKSLTISLGELSPKKKEHVLEIALPLRRTKAFIELQSVRFVPKPEQSS